MKYRSSKVNPKSFVGKFFKWKFELQYEAIVISFNV